MGRQTLEQQLAAAELKANRLRHELSSAKRKADTRRKVVVGGTVLAAMERDAALRAIVVQHLRDSITRANDRDVVSDLLAVDTIDHQQAPDHNADQTAA